jgi:hypothetical protein
VWRRSARARNATTTTTSTALSGATKLPGPDHRVSPPPRIGRCGLR